MNSKKIPILLGVILFLAVFSWFSFNHIENREDTANDKLVPILEAKVDTLQERLQSVEADNFRLKSQLTELREKVDE